MTTQEMLTAIWNDPTVRFSLGTTVWSFNQHRHIVYNEGTLKAFPMSKERRKWLKTNCPTYYARRDYL